MLDTDVDAVRDPQDRLDEMRREHTAKCAEFLRLNGPSPITAIAAGVGLSKPTVKERLLDLMQVGIVRDLDAEGPRGAGRPATWFAFEPTVAYVIGLDLGQHVERLTVVDLAGNIRHWQERAVDSHLSADARLEAAVDWVHDAREAHTGGLGECAAIGVSLPGAITNAGSLREPAAFKEWVNIPVEPRLIEAFGVDVRVMHDLDAALVAEHRMGAARGIATFVLPILWHEISAGIQVNGTIFSGAQRAEGETYHLRRLRETSQRQGWEGLPQVRQMIEAAEHEATAAQSLEDFAERAAEQIAMLILVIDPELVLLHGPLIEYESLVASVIERIPAQTGLAPIPVVTSAFGQRSTLIGVSLAVLDDASRRIVGPGLRPLELTWDAQFIPIHATREALHRPTGSGSGAQTPRTVPSN
ncbi:MAG TPA: ROK family protein [Candidatus Lumbricidophila sp.]|nr:ROK family protein [Candidatus Lumbricidophila sp.]